VKAWLRSISKNTWLVIFVLDFNIIGAALALLHGIPPFTVVEWARIALAALGGGRLIVYMGVMAPFRGLLTQTTPHWTGVGEDTDSKKTCGFVEAAGSLLSCPICSGMWTGALIIDVVTFFPAWGWWLIYVLGFLPVLELGHWLVEWLQWGAICSRASCKAAVDENWEKING
jgi:hypothetical protein